MHVGYEAGLVVLSVVVAIVASYVALDLASRVSASKGRKTAAWWLAGGALSMGTGIWSMHFIGMLAVRLPIPMSYDISITLLSLAIAVVVSAFALYSVDRGSMGLRRLLVSGLLMGLGISAMHYSGMAAMEMKPAIAYDPALFALSVVIAIVASIAALWIAFQLRTETILSAFWRKAGAALVMGAAISGMHYTGMAAAIIAPGSVCTVNPQNINDFWLASAIGGFTFVFLATTLLVSVFDAHLADRSVRHAKKLELLNADLERKADELTQSNGKLQQEMQERVRSEERNQYLAYHDGLTGLPNRSLFSKLLDHGISQARRSGAGLAVFFLDLDRFKNINDTLGHEAGDLLLQEVAARLRHCVRASDTVARLGGDEFVVLLEGQHHKGVVGPVAHKMLAALGKPFSLSGHEIRVTASIGISMFPSAGEDEQSLMKHADVAMYHAKAEGKNNYQFYSDELNANSFERLSLESSMRRALERNEFKLHYQPKVNLLNGRITGVEALIRWHHPELGTVAPANFIPIAEESGLIIPIGKWVLKTACLQARAWQESGLPPICVAVNLSARQFTGDSLLHDITEIIRDAGIEPTLLELEITESMLMQNLDRAIGIMTALKAMGVRLAIDDFGTGYSSLSNLKRFPIDTIKVDRSFVRDLPRNTDDIAVTDAIIALGRAMKLNVIAEGVESSAQVELLRDHACDEFQGFYFSKAVPADQFAELLRRQHASSAANDDTSGLAAA
jgi:diguanylate cyclase (GGDEF)-like protein